MFVIDILPRPWTLYQNKAVRVCPFHTECNFNVFMPAGIEQLLEQLQFAKLRPVTYAGRASFGCTIAHDTIYLEY